MFHCKGLLDGLWPVHIMDQYAAVKRMSFHSNVEIPPNSIINWGKEYMQSITISMGETKAKDKCLWMPEISLETFKKKHNTCCFCEEELGGWGICIQKYIQ